MSAEQISEKIGLNDSEKEKYLNYLENAFVKPSGESADKSFLDKWNKIITISDEYGVAEALNLKVCPKRPVDFSEPEHIRLEIYNSFAGYIPVIYIKNVSDFEAFITNAIYKGNAPENLSQTGASFAFGKTTRFIVLSSKPYSNVPADEIGITSEEWSEKSMIIRREHECTHYFTKNTYGISRSHLHDELIADFFGLYEAFGYYKAEYFQRFIGLVGKSGDRLKFYTSGLSEKLFRAVGETARSASDFLEKYSKTDEFLNMNREQRVKKLCETSLYDMCIE